MDEDDWAPRIQHRTAGIAAVKRRAEDSGLSRIEYRRMRTDRRSWS